MLRHVFSVWYEAYDIWVVVLRLAISLAVSFTVVVTLDRLFSVFKLGLLNFKIWWTGERPEQRFLTNPLPDPVAEPLSFPPVAVQLPMFNERAVCQAIIDSACEQAWPRNRLKIQVLFPCSRRDHGHLCVRPGCQTIKDQGCGRSGATL
jgi:beta-mannan synthase